jgi:exosortase
MATAVDRLPGQRDPGTDRASIPWVALGWVGALLILTYLPVLIPLVRQWNNDEDMGHGFFVPVVALYICWLRRDAILSTPIKRNYWGLLVIAWGAGQLMLGTLGAELFLQRSAFIISLTGCILFICGWEMLKQVSFPLFLLCFMVPIPRIIYTQITFPLQIFASRVAEATLSLLGIPVLRDGNVLELASQKLSVVEACSGIRSLLSLTFLALVYAFMFDKKVWMRWALFLLTIPIAILANSGRVTMTGLISEYDAELARGFFHTVEGWIVFLFALALLLITHRVLNYLYGLKYGRQTQTAELS